MIINEYNLKLTELKKFLLKKKSNKIKNLQVEFFVESLKNWKNQDTLNETINWFKNQKKKSNFKIKSIRLEDCKDWYFDKKKGFIRHITKEFFYVQGVRIFNTKNREVKQGWDQPILTQVRFNGGILCLFRKKINGLPHYLVEAKAEPGNPDKLQISPSIQATYSNINQKHKGKKPLYLNYINSTNSKVLISHDISEDGGRLFKKRNKIMLVEIKNNQLAKVKENFRWISLYEIKYLLNKNTWVSPHIRSIISLV